MKPNYRGTISLLLVGFAHIMLPRVVVAQVLLPESHGNWAYVASTTGGAWKELEFDDATWNHGAAPLGFGDEGIATLTRTGDAATPQTLTTYFRATFTATEENRHQQLRLKIRVDDGYVAYVNGKDLHRWNLPPGELTPETLTRAALGPPDESLYQEFDVPANLLRNGNNVLAMEVHQSSKDSSDLFLDVKLYVRQATKTPGAWVEGDARELSMQFNAHHHLGFTTRVADGFLDGGREMQMDEFGNAISGREILRVDRKLDMRLQEHLEYARSEELKALSTIDRATRIARYIDSAMTPPEGRDTCEPRSMYLARRYGSREVLLGDAVDYCGGGACRHRSLLFKLMGDDAGLACALVRGNLGSEDHNGGHAWNELRLEDGTIVIVDVMNPQPDFYFPKVGEPSLRYYLTVANAVKYPPDPRTPNDNR